MKKLIPPAAAFSIVFFCFNINGQVDNGTLPGAGDKDLNDRTSRDRSSELERIRRDMYKKDAGPLGNGRQMNFASIRKDFEKIQVLFDTGIVKTYKVSNPIDYKKISDAASELRQRAVRLRSNLFPEQFKKNKDEQADVVPISLTDVPSEIVKKLIISLNGSLAAFVDSPIFQNIKVIAPEASAKARVDLETVIAQTTALSEKAGKIR